MLEETVASRLLRLKDEVMKFRGRDRTQASDLERAAIVFIAHSSHLNKKQEVVQKKRKKKRRKERRRRRRSGSLFNCPSCYFYVFFCFCFYESLVSAVFLAGKLVFTGKSFPWCFHVMRIAWSTVHTSSLSAPRVLSHGFPRCGGPQALRISSIILCTAQCLVRQWTHAPYHSCPVVARVFKVGSMTRVLFAGLTGDCLLTKSDCMPW